MDRRKNRNLFDDDDDEDDNILAPEEVPVAEQ